MRAEELWYSKYSIPNWLKEILLKIQKSGEIEICDFPIFPNDDKLFLMDAAQRLKVNYFTLAPSYAKYKDYGFVGNLKGSGHWWNANFYERFREFRSLMVDLNTRNYYLISSEWSEAGLNLEHNIFMRKLEKHTKKCRRSWDTFIRTSCFIDNSSIMKLQYPTDKVKFYYATCKILRENGIELDF